MYWTFNIILVDVCVCVCKVELKNLMCSHFNAINSLDYCYEFKYLLFKTYNCFSTYKVFNNKIETVRKIINNPTYVYAFFLSHLLHELTGTHRQAHWQIDKQTDFIDSSKYTTRTHVKKRQLKI